MKINITAKHMALTEPLREFTLEKFDKILHHFPNITSIQVIFDVVKLTQMAEATIHVPNHQIHAKSESEDLYSAIDLLVDKLYKQAIKHKEKDGHH